VFYSKGQFHGYLFSWVLFLWLYELSAHSFVDFTVGGYNEFYNQDKEIWEASYGDKTKIYNPFTFSVMKDEEIVRTYYNSTIVTW